MKLKKLDVEALPEQSPLLYASNCARRQQGGLVIEQQPALVRQR